MQYTVGRADAQRWGSRRRVAISWGGRERPPFLQTMVHRSRVVSLCMVAFIGLAMFLVAPAGAVYGAAAPSLPLSLTALMREAVQCAPAFLKANDAAEAVALSARQREAKNSPRGDLEAGVRLESGGTVSGAKVTATWPITDDITLSGQKRVGPMFPASGGSPGDFLQVAWNKRLWPPTPDDTDPDHVDQLGVQAAWFQAEVALLSAFYEAKHAVANAAIARESLRLARERFALMAYRFEAGTMSVADWREEQDGLVKAEDNARAADRRVHDALWELSETVWGGCGHAVVSFAMDDEWVNGETMPPDADGAWLFAQFADDLAWDSLTTGLASQLQVDTAAVTPLSWSRIGDVVDGTVFETLLEANDRDYQQKRIVLEQAELHLREADEAGGPQVGASARVTQPIGGPSAQSLSWSVGVTVGFDFGPTTKLVAEEAVLKHRQATRDLETSLRRLHRDGYRHWEVLASAEKAVETAATMVARTEEALHIATVRHEAGFTTELEVEEARLALQAARVRHVQAQDELKQLQVQFGFKVGILPSDYLVII